MIICGEEWTSHAVFYGKSWEPAREVVAKALSERHHYGDQILVFSQGGCPWKEHLFELEKEMKVQPIFFVVYSDSNGSWRLQAVPPKSDSFGMRVPLPEPWRGLRDQSLDAALAASTNGTVPPGAVFVHANGFIGGHATKEGVLAMARAAIAGAK
eukprot:TRINITY_DN4626_c0_g1_i1.p1 TRINITY_DN4626_c0_g1~~TRINITY_DN4626_c0_g1_i1.p1  ORF type:complete len:155 (+),score=25.75 TRINITY_DN4626_c0_g1_i1:613-1077(+)